MSNLVEQNELTLLPLSDDGDYVFSCSLYGTFYSFRIYFVQGFEDFWYLDIFGENQMPLAVGRRLVNGSTNFLKGFVKFDEEATVCLAFGKPSDLDAPSNKLNVIWWQDETENVFTNKEVFDTLEERFAGWK